MNGRGNYSFADRRKYQTENELRTRERVHACHIQYMQSTYHLAYRSPWKEHQNLLSQC
jgi:hypothetical protein